MQTERLLAIARRPTTLVGARLVGAAFAVGWTPCIGPILGSILTYAAPTGSPGLGATLLFTYSLGLGIPFLLSGLFVTRTHGRVPLAARPLARRQRDGGGRVRRDRRSWWRPGASRSSPSASPGWGSAGM